MSEDQGRGQTHDERCACREYVNGWCIDCGQRELSSGRGQTPHHEFWLDPNDPENPACRVCDKPASHTWHSPAWCSARKTLSGFRAGACIYAAGHAGDHKWADAESFSGRRPSAPPPTDDVSLCPKCGDARHDGWGCAFCKDTGPCALSDDASSQTRQDKLDSITRAHLDDTYLPDDEPPTHDGPCTRSYDPDGKPLHYCSVCFQDVP